MGACYCVLCGVYLNESNSVRKSNKKEVWSRCVMAGIRCYPLPSQILYTLLGDQSIPSTASTLTGQQLHARISTHHSHLPWPIRPSHTLCTHSAFAPASTPANPSTQHHLPPTPHLSSGRDPPAHTLGRPGALSSRDPLVPGRRRDSEGLLQGDNGADASRGHQRRIRESGNSAACMRGARRGCDGGGARPVVRHVGRAWHGTGKHGVI